MTTKLKIRRIGIDTYRENIVYMPVGCEICKSEGFHALSKLTVHYGKKSILATLNTTEDGILREEEIGLSLTAFRRLGAPEGAEATVSHPNPLRSTDLIRKKLEARRLSKEEFLSIVQDIAAYRYSNIELTAFVVACAKRNLSEKEIVFLTEAMIETGETIDWGLPMVMDKHCVGGIPGNRTTMVVVPIVAAFGLPVPKTSSRAITSPSGTADTMETITNVRLTLAQMKKIVAEENACIAWGGAIALAPVDDIIISVERPLRLDSEGQMIASILSKKKAAGSTHFLLDIPVGPTAKVRNRREAVRLKNLFERVGRKIGLNVRVVFTGGSQPVGRGIGPVLEAEDVLKVLKNEPDAPPDLKEKSIFLAGSLIDFSGRSKGRDGMKTARKILESGQAWEKFQRIAERQGPLKQLKKAAYSHLVRSPSTGTVRSIHNQKMAQVARLAGAPTDPAAGVFLRAKVGDKVKKGGILFEIFAENQEELQFAARYVADNPDIVV
jgi:thymidine phosphorylase